MTKRARATTAILASAMRRKAVVKRSKINAKDAYNLGLALKPARRTTLNVMSRRRTAKTKETSTSRRTSMCTSTSTMLEMMMRSREMDKLTARAATASHRQKTCIRKESQTIHARE